MQTRGPARSAHRLGRMVEPRTAREEGVEKHLLSESVCLHICMHACILGCSLIRLFVRQGGGGGGGRGREGSGEGARERDAAAGENLDQLHAHVSGHRI